MRNDTEVTPPADAARYCPECDDGDGNCAFPYYGVAPHNHERSAAGWITTKIKPRDEWTLDFREDPDEPGCGTYLRCPYCGSGEPNSA